MLTKKCKKQLAGKSFALTIGKIGIGPKTNQGVEPCYP